MKVEENWGILEGFSRELFWDFKKYGRLLRESNGGFIGICGGFLIFMMDLGHTKGNMEMHRLIRQLARSKVAVVCTLSDKRTKFGCMDLMKI